eukprot:TRINITY_DN86826_c0_g1_i1.p1 TRINITY_DN86826_c0_g1~~TRINITY_DN86826_c0_g1_i1.p1  ORF type:complete len:310 (-),score=37.31 TRINITY_DN86826_c0_g1_i1:145-1074(-)
MTATQPVSLVFKNGQLVGEMDWRVCCASNQNDGGFMPKPMDTVPLNGPAPLRAKGGTRYMKHGPAKTEAPVVVDTVPTGGKNTAKKELHSRRDKPWTGTTKPKEFSRPEYMTDMPLAAAPGPVGPPTMSAPPPPPMRTGKVMHKPIDYPHIPQPEVKPEPRFKGKNMRTGKGPALFDNDEMRKGPQQLAPPPLDPVDRLAQRAAAPRPIGRMKTNTRKKDTFGDYPKYVSDPYKDDPLKELDEKNNRWAKNKPNIYTCVCKGAPTIPVVNVWDHPACLQSKAGVVKGRSKISGEDTMWMSDKGRLGTTV